MKIDRSTFHFSFSGFLLSLFLLTVAGPACSLKLGPTLGPLEEKVISGSGDNKVLVLDVRGFISNDDKKSVFGQTVDVGMVEKIREALDQAENDDDIKAVWIQINSPGGTVTSSDIIYHEVKTFKEKRKIKVYASALDLAASGGYYIAVAADTIFAHPTSLIGSIGVISVKVNAEALMQKIGLDWEVVKSAEKKDFLSPFRPLTKEERELFQETIDGFHDRFVSVIAENRRDLDREAVQKLADGRIYSAEQALKYRLIDHVAYSNEAEELIKKDLDVSEIKMVTYHRSGEYKSNVYSSLPSNPIINLINFDFNFSSYPAGPAFMYLWMP